MGWLRTLLAAIGALVAGFGLWTLMEGQQVSQLIQVLEWAAAGVILHDAIAAPIVIGLGWLVHRRVPPKLARPVVFGLVMAATMTVAAFAVLIHAGDDLANPTLLPRNYLLGLGLAWVTIMGGAALVFGFVNSNDTGRWRRGPSDGR
ncbi:MAG: hypothetical protein ACSLE6_04095 [Mycobacterium sp.]